MKLRLNIYKIIENVLGYSIVLVTIMGTYSMIERDQVYDISEILMTEILCLLCFLMSFFLLIKSYSKISKKNIRVFIFTTLISVGCVLIPGVRISAGIIKWVVPIIAFSCLFMLYKNTKRIWRIFGNVMILLASVSLILYLSGTVLHIINPTRTAVYLYNDAYRSCATYFGIQYEAQSVQGLNVLNIAYRNCGFFIEAPMFNILLCIAFAAELSFQDKPRSVALIILGVTIITTFSTTGILFLVLMAAIRIFIAGDAKKMHIVKILIVPILLLLLIYIFVITIENKTQTESGSGSYSVRMDHLIAFLKMWRDRPLFGYGFENTEDFYKYTQYKQGFSVGLPALLGRSGIFMFGIYILPWIKRVLYAVRFQKKELFFWIGTIFCLFMTAVTYKTIMILILCSQLFWKTEEEK